MTTELSTNEFTRPETDRVLLLRKEARRVVGDPILGLFMMLCEFNKAEAAAPVADIEFEDVLDEMSW